MTTIAFIGAGNMSGAIIGGLIENGVTLKKFGQVLRISRPWIDYLTP